MSLTISEILKGHKNLFGEENKCYINDEIYYGEFDAVDDYAENCNISPDQTFTIKDQDGNLIFTICGNHISQLEELKVDGFLDLYSVDLDVESFDVDSDHPLKTILEQVLADAKKFE